MSNGRKSFLLHFDSLGILDQLTDEQCGKLFLACRDYNLGEELKLDATLELVFFPFKAQFIRDKEKYQNKVHASQINGSKGGRPKNPAKPKKPSGLSGNPAKAKKGVSVSVSDSVNDSESVSVSDSDIKPLVAFAPVDSGIFEYWKAVMGKDNSVKPTAGRMSKIKARLKDGYTEEQIKSAIDGCKSSDHHMGKNDSGKIFDCLTLICRSAEKLDMFIGYTKVFNPEVKRDQDLDAWANGSNISQVQGEIYDHE